MTGDKLENGTKVTISSKQYYWTAFLLTISELSHSSLKESTDGVVSKYVPQGYPSEEG